MTPAEIKAAAAAQIVLIDAALAGETLPELGIPATTVPNDTRAKRLIDHSQRLLARNAVSHEGVKRRMHRIRTLLGRYIA